jgi:hypothetical protein
METLFTKSGEYAQNYQAILTLPFFHVGSEKFSIDNAASLFYSIRGSWQWQLPMINVAMSRTSLEQSCNNVQLLSDSLLDKPILKELNDKPILLLVCSSNLNPAEQHIINKSRLLYEEGELKLYKLHPSQLQKSTSAIQNIYNNRQQVLVQHTFYLSNQPASNAIVKYFVPAAGFRQGNGFRKFKKGTETIFEDGIGNLKTNDSLHISLWVKINPLAESLPVLKCEQLNIKGEVVDFKETSFKWSVNVYHQCVLAELTVIAGENLHKLRINFEGESNYANLLIRKKGEDVYVPSGNVFFFNNIPVE